MGMLAQGISNWKKDVDMELIVKLLTSDLDQRYGPYKSCPNISDMAGFTGLYGTVPRKKREQITQHLEVDDCPDCVYAIDQLANFSNGAEGGAVSDQEVRDYLDDLQSRLAH